MPLDETIKSRLSSAVDAQMAELTDIYCHFHQNPELSEHEEETAKRVAEEMTRLGFKVHTGLGGHGVAAVLDNGPGPTVLVRADMDALPLVEATGLPFASKVTAVDDAGRQVGVMHACGHDMHTTCLIGAARILAEMKDAFSGRVIFVGQPAEETVGGARLMMEDGLYDLVGRPDMAVALHVYTDLPAGHIGLRPGIRSSFSQSIDVVIKGIGGHGASPHRTKDPIVLAAQFILAVQTLVSRETNPAEMGLITIGAVHGGTKRNIIPEAVTLNLTLRSYTAEVGQQLIEGVGRAAEGLARAAGLPPELYPDVLLVEQAYPPIYNDPDMSARLTETFQGLLGSEKVVSVPPSNGSEDFSYFGITDPPVPTVMYNLGVTEPDVIERANNGEGKVTPVHDAKFYPNVESSLPAGVGTMAASVLELLAPGK